MLPIERKQMILELLSKQKTISTQELCKILFISQSTVRRDLIEMEKENLIIRSHGGAMLPQDSTNEKSYTHRDTQNQLEKTKIADMASTFIEDGLSLFLDSSTTVKSIVPFLKEFKDLIIITNGLHNALELSEYKNHKTILIGGDLYPDSSSTVGTNAISSLSNYRVDLSIVSCRGLDEEGVYEANEPQAIIKQKMLQYSQKKLLLCDSSKFDNRFFYKLTDLDTFNYIITEKILNSRVQQNISDKGSILIEA